MRTDMTGQTLKVIGFLMAYPEEAILSASGEIRTILHEEAWLSVPMRARLDDFLEAMKGRDIMDLQEEYVALFDRTPSLSLHLFEHIHGDSRDRGQAMVELDGLYREMGLENVSEHTPDYLPMFLEYLSLLPVDQARDNLDAAVDVIAAIGGRLKKRESRYAVLFDALAEAASRKPDEKKLKAALVANPGEMMSRAEMDAAWEEQFALADPAKTGEGGGGCPKVEDMLARMNAPLDATNDKKGARS